MAEVIAPLAAELPNGLTGNERQHAPITLRSRLLLVDDNAGSRTVLQKMLEQRGYDVSAAPDGSTALAMLQSHRFDLVLLDVRMPDISGLVVLERLRQSRSPTELPVIMVTANDESADIVQALELGANDYVTKPIDLGVTLARIRTHLQLKHSVEQVLELEAIMTARNVALEAANIELMQFAKQKQIELETAARVQAAFLPTSLPIARGVRFAWAFEPCQELAGDSLNILSLDANHVAIYVLDVSGHGVPAALLAVAATRILSVGGDADSILFTKAAEDAPATPTGPAEVANRLNSKFAWKSGAEQFLTLFYGVYNLKTRELTYVSAGHPGGILISKNADPLTLDGGGLPIGIGEGYEEQRIRLQPGDRIYLYSDGVTEAMTPSREMLGKEKLLEHLLSGRTATVEETVISLLKSVKNWQGEKLQDDISILAMECG